MPIFSQAQLPSFEHAAAYLAAFIDGEGTVSLSDSKGTRTVRVANTDRNLLAYIEQCCEVLGIEIRVRLKSGCPSWPDHWKEAWDGVISGRNNLERVLEVVPIRSKEKRMRLESLVAAYRPRIPDAETLHTLYWDKQMSTAMIGNHYGVSNGTVVCWMRKYGISSRTLSESVQLDWDTQRRDRASV